MSHALPGYSPLLFFLHHVELGLGLLQLLLLLLNFLQQLLTLLEQAFLKGGGIILLETLKVKNLRDDVCPTYNDINVCLRQCSGFNLKYYSMMSSSSLSVKRSCEQILNNLSVS